MNIYDVFAKAVELGIKHDFRPKREVLSYPWQEQISYNGKKFVNPYADTGIMLAKDLGVEVRRVAVGIDIGQDEVLTAIEWEEQTGKTVDLFLSHHPRGKPSSSFPAILKTQLGNFKNLGVSVKNLEKYYDQQVKEMERELLSSNFARTYGTVEVLKRHYLSIHTPADNLSARFVEKKITNACPKTIADCLEVIRIIPEYQRMEEEFLVHPTILSGNPKNKLGRFILSEFVGGEEGPIQIFKAIKRSGVSSLIVMHISDEGLQEAKKEGLNIISAGHNASDSIGLNILCDELETHGIDIMALGGFLRFSRLSKT